MNTNWTIEKVQHVIDKCGDDASDEQKKSIVCSLLGHSRIVYSCFGYISCGRCGQQIGDTLEGMYDASKDVIIGHKCDACVKNYEQMTDEDKFMAPDPF